MSVLIAAYDIGNDKRRLRVAKILQRVGSRVQESVFELWIDTSDLASLRQDLGAVLAAEDCFDVYPIDDRPNRPRYRWQKKIELRPVVRFVGMGSPGYNEA